MRTDKREYYDIIVVGSGIAGLYAALKASPFARVCLVTKGRLQDTNTWLAQGGIAAAVGDDDSPREHLQDTLAAGAGACNPEAVAVLVEEGPASVRELLDLGIPFDYEQGSLALTREGAHHKSRILHCGGDATGRVIQQTLQEKIRTLINVDIEENVFVTELLLHDGSVCGIKTLNGSALYAGAVILATGGLGQVYSRTTNPPVATGDGVAMAYRAGARVADMEFIQFHPTAFQGYSEDQTFLISEAVRGEGAVIRNVHGRRFMPEYHELAELGPRDVVARAILDQMKRQGGTPVWLDITHKSREFLQQRFPTIFSAAKERGLDMGQDWLPVSPAAHYAMGGILTGLEGETNLPGLYACGEAACSGVHGANRLASNSLLEGLVFAARAVHAIEKSGYSAYYPPRVRTVQTNTGKDIASEELRTHLRKRMFEDAGVLRSGEGLSALQDELRKTVARISENPLTQEVWELKNLLLVSQLIVAGALWRQESRGGHYRSDFPHEDSRYACRGSQARQKEGNSHAPIAV
jgi:L-aspartate oxidase